MATNPKKKKLTIKQKKFVKAKVEGKTNIEAYAEAGYSTNNKDVVKVESSRLKNRPHIQAAIEEALEINGATPEWAVRQLKKVAEQDDELGAKRLASKDILELHGWNKADRPTMQLDIKNAFFGNGRETGERKVVDADQT